MAKDELALQEQEAQIEWLKAPLLVPNTKFLSLLQVRPNNMAGVSGTRGKSV